MVKNSFNQKIMPIAFTLLLASGCSKAKVVELATVEVSKGDVLVQVTIGGRVEASQQTGIMAPDDLVVEELRVANGQKVKKGEVLARLDATKVFDQIRAEEVRLSQSASQLKTSSIRFVGLNRDFERAKRLLKLGAVSIEEKEKIAQEIEIQKSQIATQQREQQTIQQNISRLRTQAEILKIPAPFDGVITYQWVPKDTFVKGSSVKKGDLLFRLSSEGKMVLKSTLREDDVSFFSVGQKLPIRFPARPGVEAPGRVLMVDNAATVDKESGVGSFRIYLEFDPVPDVKPGMEAVVEFTPQKKEGVLLIPKTALNTGSTQGHEVRVLEGAVSRVQKIEVGLIGDLNVEVISGLSLGQKVMARYDE